MTAPLIAPVIPSSVLPAARGRRMAGTGRRLPAVAVPVPVPSVPGDVVYGFDRIDVAGRIADRAVISLLGWRYGDRLTLTEDAGAVTARRDPAGMAAMTAKPYIAIPAAVPAEDMLSAYPLAVVDQAIRAHGAFPHAQGGRQ